MLAVNGDPATGASEPFALMLKTEMLFADWFATKTNFPAGSTVIPVGRASVANGDPGTALSWPVPVFTAKAETVFAFWLLTKRTLCTESNAMNSAPAPAGNGEPATSERAPELFMANTETEPEPELVTKAKPAVTIGGGFVLPMPHPFNSRMATRKDKINHGAGGKVRERCCDESMAFNLPPASITLKEIYSTRLAVVGTSVLRENQTLWS